MVLYCISIFTLLNLYKSIKFINFNIIIFSLSLKAQIIVILVFYLLKRNVYISLVLINLIRKIKITIKKKKFNTGLLFIKTMNFHLFLFAITLIAGIQSVITGGKIWLVYLQNVSIIFNIFGIYWSAQENLWSGLWNWNLIENSIFIISVFLVILVHNKQYYLYKELILFTLFTIYIYYNHIPITLSVHNFTTNKITYYSTAILILLLLFKIIVKKYQIYLLILYLCWFIPIIKLAQRFNIIQYLILFNIIYFIYSVNTKISYLLSLTGLTILIIQKIILNYNKNTSVVSIHKTAVTFIVLIILLQSAYTLCVLPRYNLEFNITNTRCGIVLNDKKFLIKLKKLKKLNTILILSNNKSFYFYTI